MKYISAFLTGLIFLTGCTPVVIQQAPEETSQPQETQEVEDADGPILTPGEGEAELTQLGTFLEYENKEYNYMIAYHSEWTIEEAEAFPRVSFTKDSNEVGGMSLDINHISPQAGLVGWHYETGELINNDYGYEFQIRYFKPELPLGEGIDFITEASRIAVIESGPRNLIPGMMMYQYDEEKDPEAMAILKTMLKHAKKLVETKTYTTPDGAYSLEYPASWTAEENENMAAVSFKSTNQYEGEMTITFNAGDSDFGMGSRGFDNKELTTPSLIEMKLYYMEADPEFYAMHFEDEEPDMNKILVNIVSELTPTGRMTFYYDKTVNPEAEENMLQILNSIKKN